MKRPIAPFAVEYKRRPKLNKTSEPSLWSGSIGKGLKSLLQSDQQDDQAALSAGVFPPLAPRKTGLRDTNEAASNLGHGEIKRPSRILETRQPVIEKGSTKAVADGMEASLPFREEKRGQSRKIVKSRPPEGRSHNQPPIVEEQAPEMEAASASTPIPTAMPFSTGSNRKLSRSVALRRARMKGLEFQDRWKCDLLRQPRRLMRRLGN
ncbi:hypothetical protein [Aureimonas ureilytica]|uniref:hypothetical protein n=1 Tax=Aureimonas ureilytica TaxID=401562 RepID=UPI000A41817D|nr:hypothetical protein [Aureimonas ureilytica]